MHIKIQLKKMQLNFLDCRFNRCVKEAPLLKIIFWVSEEE